MVDISEIMAAIKLENTFDGSTINTVLAVFSNSERAFDGPHAQTVAEATARNQQKIHVDLFRKIANGINIPHNDELVSNINTFTQNYVTRIFTNSAFQTSGGSNGSVVVKSSTKTPVILDSDYAPIIDCLAALSTPEKKIQYACLAIAAYLRGTRLVSQAYEPANALGKTVTAMQGLIECYLYMTDLTANESSSLMMQVAKMRGSIDKQGEDMRANYAATTKAIEEDLASLRTRTGQIIEAADIASQKASNLEIQSEELAASVDAKAADFEDKFAQADSKASAFMEAVRVEANFEDLKIHWVDRSKSAGKAFKLSAVVLGILLIVVPIFAIVENSVVTAFIKKLVDAAAIDVGQNPGAVTVAVATISRLIIITIPLALYFWLIKLVVRFNMRSLMLMDDARQRATMLETYYRMIEKEAATKEDRALVLQALMRPAPGHGPDSVEPPNFTDVIDKAMGRA